MSKLNIRFLVACTAFSLVGLVSVASVSADSRVATCNSGTLVSATLKVDGVAVSINASGSAYALTVCRIQDMGFYTVQVGLYDGGVMKEDLLVANSEKAFEVSFVPTTGDTPTVADFYGRIQSFVGGANVVVSVKPTALSLVDDPNRTCGGREFSDAACVARPATRDMVAMLSGSVRFDTSSRISNYSKLAGATVSASASLYDVSLSGPCPLVSAGFTGSDGGTGRPAGEQSSAGTTTLIVKMVGPHFKQNGSTLNTGSLEVNIPKETITACFGGTAGELATSLAMTRTEAGVTAEVVKTTGTPATGLQYSTTVVGDALKISVSAISFSDPTYSLLLHKASVASTGGSTTTGGSGAISSNQLSRSQGKTARSLAALAKFVIPAGSTVTLKVVASSAKYCKVTGFSVKGLKVGTCKVTMTVKDKNGVSRSKTMTLKVV